MKKFKNSIRQASRNKPAAASDEACVGWTSVDCGGTGWLYSKFPPPLHKLTKDSSTRFF
jgi:hypothetical protein